MSTHRSLSCVLDGICSGRLLSERDDLTMMEL